MHGSDTHHAGAAPAGWVRWRASRLGASSDDSPWLREERLRSFRFVLIMTIVALAVLVIRGFRIGGPSPWPDLVNLLCCVIVFLLLKRRPGWLRPLSWTVLVCFFLNALEGPFAAADRPVAPFLMLLPLLVLYGALLGDRWMVISALVVTMSLYAHAAAAAWPLSLTDLLFLTNMIFVTVVAGLTALGLWLQHRRMVENLNSQAHDLRRELDARARLHAILFHDLGNPLTALLNTTALANRPDQDPGRLLGKVDAMARRMRTIIRSARSMESGQDAARSGVTVADLHGQLAEVFSSRLAAKEQRFLLAEGAELGVRAAVPVLSHSVLGNIVNNAVKFSPRGAIIGMAARAESGRVRIEVRDQGLGFSPEVLRHGSRGEEFRSERGTDGEEGSGYGLRIAALCLERMDGALEVRNLGSGGGVVAVLLPAAGSGHG